MKGYSVDVYEERMEWCMSYTVVLVCNKIARYLYFFLFLHKNTRW